MAAETITIYDSVTINNAKPIEGSVSMSTDTGSVTKLKYEGGGVAAYKTTAHPDVTLSWKVPGACSSASSAAGSATLTTDTGQSVTITGILNTAPGWDQSWGAVTEYSCVGKVGTDT